VQIDISFIGRPFDRSIASNPSGTIDARCTIATAGPNRYTPQNPCDEDLTSATGRATTKVSTLWQKRLDDRV
jgi:hypothetical protein